MRLKRVKIFGFKTFADRTDFNVDGGLIAVVGPNGCGKSNLVDAILWGLGEGNARSLRAAHNQDVIFSGSARRKGVGFAEVSLLFDNEDGSLPVDSSEVSVTRRLTRSGESQYSINRQACRQRDIFELLADSGLGRAGYAIVGQKDIDNALAASPEERRAWVDEAAGVQRYRARKLESQRRLAAAQQHLTRVHDILSELEAQREPLRDEAEIAKRYKSALNSLREVESGLLMDEVAKTVREIAELEKRIAESSKTAGAEISRAEFLEGRSRGIGLQVSELEREMDEIRAVQQSSLTTLERAAADLRLAEQRLQSLDDLERSLDEEAGKGQARVTELLAEIQALVEEEKAEIENLDRIRLEHSGAGDEAKSLQSNLQEIEARLLSAREAHANRLKQEAQAEQQKERIKLAKRELKGIEDSLPDLESAAREAQAQFEVQQSSLRELQSRVKSAEEELDKIRAQEDQDAQAGRRLLAERATLDGRRRGIEATIDAHEGLNHGSKAVLEAAERKILAGSYMPVGEAVQVDKDLALAIETALGGSVNDLIVDHDSDAKAAIGFLKEHRLGRATFQPINLMRPFEPSFDLRKVLGEKGVLGRASELVHCEYRVKPVIDSLLGRVLILESLDDSLRLAKTTGWSRMVTLDGEVIHNSGAVTGGVNQKQGYGLIQRKSDLKDLVAEIDKIDGLIAEAEARTKKRSSLRQNTLQELSELRSETDRGQSDFQEAKDYFQALNDELQSTLKAKSRLQHELESLNPAGPQVEAVDLQSIEGERDDLIHQLASKSANAEAAETLLREAEQRIAQAQLRLYAARKRLEVAQETESSRDRRLANMEPERAKARQEIERATVAGKTAEADSKSAKERLDKSQESKRVLLEESLQLLEDAKAARANAQSMGDGVHQAELNRARAEAKKAAALQRLLEEYGFTEEDAIEQEGTHEIPADAPALVSRLRRELKSMGDVNLGAIEAFERLSVRFDELDVQQRDIVDGIQQVQASIRELDALTRDRFMETFSKVQEAYGRMFQKLFGGGEGQISLTEPDNVLESGLEIEVQLPGKRRQQLQ
ncbi:MAG TPA: chromosome segregation protein SMC, partial [Fimbriimonadaceae bacterium]|nr:chromosome segregation protein SMC [Fimbriimonadaceae bacterium]